MKPFTSSILSVNEAAIQQPTTLKSFKEESIISLLEFDEINAQKDLDSTREYYLNLMNAAAKNEFNCNEVLKPVFKKFDSLYRIICSLGSKGYLNSIDDNDYCSSLNYMKSKSPTTIVSLKTIVRKPIYTDSVVAFAAINKYCNEIIHSVDHPESLQGLVNRDLEDETCMILSKACNVDESHDTNKFVYSYMNSFDIEEREFNGYTLDSVDISPSSIFVNDFDIKRSDMDMAVEALKINCANIEPNVVKAIMDNLCNFIHALGTIIIRTNSASTKLRAELVKANMSAIRQAVDLPMVESMSMFGDEIDSSSVFDTLDQADFLHSDYMDLSLVTEHMLNMNGIEGRRYGIALEAKLFAEGRFDELTLVQEAVGRKIADGFRKVVEFIKSVANKFVEKILFNIANEKAWLTKYKNIIQNYQPVAGTKVTIYCNLANAIKYSEKVIPATISYNELKAGANFTDEASFFKYYYAKMFPNLDNSPNVPKDGSIADKCKIFLGAKYPEGTGVERTFEQLNSGDTTIMNMYNWLLNTEKLAKTTRQQISAIDKTVDNYTASAEAYAPKPEQKANESTYYSYIMEAIVNAPKAEAPAAAGGNATTNQAQQNNNPSPNSLRMTPGDTKAEVEKSGDNADVIQKRMNIYLNVTRSVLQAKMTAVTYAHKEMLDIMRFIVKSKMGNSADIEQVDPNGQQQNNNQQNQNNNQTNNKNQNANNQNQGNKQPGFFRRMVNTVKNTNNNS